MDRIHRYYSLIFLLLLSSILLIGTSAAQSEPLPDLVITSVDAPASVNTQGQLEVTYTIRNQGEGPAAGNWCDILYFSMDEKNDGTDTIMAYNCAQRTLEAGAEISQILAGTVPNAQPGSNYILIRADAHGNIQESDEENNIHVKAVTVTVPDLTITSVNAPPSVHTQEQIEVTYTVRNQGDGTASWRIIDYLYLSTDEIRDPSDQLLSHRDLQRTIPAGSEYTESLIIPFPKVPRGSYYLLMTTDIFNYLYESDEGNNVLAQPVTVTVPDLIVTSLEAPTVVRTQETVQFTYTVRNQGDGLAEGVWYDTLTLSKDDIWDSSDSGIKDIQLQRKVEPGGEYSDQLTATIPSVDPGAYLLLVMTDSRYKDVIYESDEQNNVLAIPITVTAPDLVISSDELPSSVHTNQNLQISYTVKNLGDGLAEGYWYDSVVLSKDDKWDRTDPIIATDYRSRSLGPSSEYSLQLVGRVPKASSGLNYMILKTDTYGTIFEPNKANNLISKPVTVKIPDLVVSSLDVPSVVGPGERLEVTYSVQNLGEGIAEGEWEDSLFLSKDEIFDIFDTDIGRYSAEHFLEPSSAYSGKIQAIIPQISEGAYFLILYTDIYSYPPVIEVNEKNNTIVIPVTILAPDLSVTSVQAPSTATSREQIEIIWSVKNQGQGAARGTWTDTIYFSQDDVWDTGDSVLASVSNARSLAPGAEYSETVSATLPDVPEGTHYLLTATDHWQGLDSIYESREWNNLVPTMIAIGREGGLSEVSSTESDLVADLLAQRASMTGAAVQGDLIGTLDFSQVDLVSITSGSFSGKGFFKGTWESTLETRAYHGEVNGVAYFVPAEKRVYLKGAVSRGEANGIVEGYLTESVEGSGIYDHYIATWRLGRLGDKTVSATLNIEGTLNYLESMTYPSTGIHILETAVNGKTYGHYTEDISTVLMHLQVTDQVNPYNGEGFSIISYTSNAGQGEGWTYDWEVSQDMVDLKGFFTEPLKAIVTGNLDNQIIPGKVILTLEKVTLGLPPSPQINLDIWGPSSASPGEKVNYLIEVRNDGQKTAENIIIYVEFPYWLQFVDCTHECQFYPPHSNAFILFTMVGTLPPREILLKSISVQIPGGINEDGYDIDAVVGIIIQEVMENIRDDCNNFKCVCYFCTGNCAPYECPPSGPPDFIKEDIMLKKATDRLNTSLLQARDPNRKSGPEGNVQPGQKLTYKIEYENEGEGIAYGVYFTDQLEVDLDASTLEIGPVMDVKTGAQIAPAGHYDPATRTITWLVGEVGSKEGGIAEFSVNVKSDALPGTEIINFGTVYFPSVPEVTRTNGIVSIIPVEEENKSPVAVAGGPYEANEGSLVTFDASDSSDPEGAALQYRWDFTNDGTWDTEWSPESSASHLWPDDYQGDVILEVSDGTLTSTATSPVIVKNVAPVVNAGPPQEVRAGNVTRFNGSFTDAGYPDTHTAIWDFGDSTTETGTVTELNSPPLAYGFANRSHIFTQKGSYNVTLNVTDDDGGSGRSDLKVTVKPVPATLRIFPKNLNLASRGIFVAFVTLPRGYSVHDINISTVRCGGAPVERTIKSKRIQNIIGFVFRKDKLENIAVGDKVALTLSGKIRYAGKAVDFEGIDTVKVIRKQLKGLDESEEISRLNDESIFERYNKNS